VEFPTKPTKRERERQQAIAAVISGMAYTTINAAINPDYIPPEPVVLERTDEGQRGFNHATFQEYVSDV